MARAAQKEQSQKNIWPWRAWPFVGEEKLVPLNEARGGDRMCECRFGGLLVGKKVKLDLISYTIFNDIMKGGHRRSMMVRKRSWEVRGEKRNYKIVALGNWEANQFRKIAVC